jgi:hypothetical protein
MQKIRGEWFNAYSCLLAFANPAPEKKAEVTAFCHKLVRLFSLLYAAALEQVSTMDLAVFEIIELDGFQIEHLHALRGAHDRCEVVLQWIQREIVTQNANHVLKIEAPILSRVYNQLGNGIVELNNARKITEFPIPYPLAQMVTFMLALHWLMTVAMAAIYFVNPFHASAVAFVVILSFWTIQFISLELEMPFGDDPNDLPLEDMQKDYNLSLIDLLRPYCVQNPRFELNQVHREFRVTQHDLESVLEELVETYPEPLRLPVSLMLDEAAVPRLSSGKRLERKNSKRRRSRRNGSGELQIEHVGTDAAFMSQLSEVYGSSTYRSLSQHYGSTTSELVPSVTVVASDGSNSYIASEGSSARKEVHSSTHIGRTSTSTNDTYHVEPVESLHEAQKSNKCIITSGRYRTSHIALSKPSQCACEREDTSRSAEDTSRTLRNTFDIIEKFPLAEDTPRITGCNNSSLGAKYDERQLGDMAIPVATLDFAALGEGKKAFQIIEVTVPETSLVEPNSDTSCRSELQSS